MYKGYLIDLDGTIYVGKNKIDAAKPFVESLKEKNIPFLFLTNNTTRSPKDVKINLEDNFDILVNEDQIYTATTATIGFMNQMAKGKKVYIIGESGLKDAIIESGFIIDEDNPDYVIVGLDRDINYEKLKIATFAIQKGALLIGTNPDKNMPHEEGLVPGAGTLIAAIETSTQKEAVIIGKPSEIIMEQAVTYLGLSKEEVIMVGDNYQTDILAGINNGIDTLLVLTGFTKKSEVPSLPKPPTFVVDSLSEWSV